MEIANGDTNTIADGLSKRELANRRRRFVESVCNEDKRSAATSINFATLLDKLKTLIRSNSFKPYEKALLVGRDFWSSHIATNIFHSVKNDVSNSAAKRFFLYSVSHMPMIYLTSFILMKRLENSMAVFSQVVEEIMYEMNRDPEVLLSLFRNDKIEKRRAATKTAFDRMVKLLERRAYLKYLRKEKMPAEMFASSLKKKVGRRNPPAGVAENLDDLREMIRAPASTPGTVGDALKTNLSSINDDAIKNVSTNDGRRFSKDHKKRGGDGGATLQAKQHHHGRFVRPGER